MKRTIYLSVITIVTIGCIIFGTVMQSGGFGFGLSLGVKEEEQSLEDFHKIQVDTNIIELTISSGSRYHLSYSATKDLIPEYTVENGTLVIEQNKKKKNILGTNKCKVYVEIPDDIAVSDLDIMSDIGDVKIKDLKVEECTGKVDLGELEITGSTIEKLDWENDKGDISLEDCSFQKVDLKIDLGEVVIQNAKQLTGYEIDAQTNVGEVKVNGEEYGRKCKINGSVGKMRIRVDLGDIKIK